MRIRHAHRNVLREWKLLEILLFSRSLRPKSRRLPLSEGTAFLWRSNEPSLLSSYDVRSTINRNLFSLCRIERVSTCAFRILGMKMMGEASTTPLPNNVRVSRVFFSFFFLSLSSLSFYADLYERSGGFTGQDISMFVFSNIFNIFCCSQFSSTFHASIFKRSFLRVINSSRALEFTAFARGGSYFFFFFD